MGLIARPSLSHAMCHPGDACMRSMRNQATAMRHAATKKYLQRAVAPAPAAAEARQRTRLMRVSCDQCTRSMGLNARDQGMIPLGERHASCVHPSAHLQSMDAINFP
jgi:hypothetical protein